MVLHYAAFGPCAETVVSSKCRISVTISDHDHKLLSAFAREHSVSLAWIARQALTEFITHHVHEGMQLPLRLPRVRESVDKKF